MDLFDVFELNSPELGKTKTIRVFVPSMSNRQNHRFSVLYMHDGQNLFEDLTASFGVSWRIRESIREHIHEGGTPWIVVGIDSESEDRWNEYSPFPCDEFAMSVKSKNIPEGGKAKNYIEFLVKTLKPWIDDRYPTDPNHTALAGSSMGGLVSLYGVTRYPEVFRQIGVFSPAWWFHAEQSKRLLQDASFPVPIRIYQDMGTAETSSLSIATFPQIYLHGAREAAMILNGNPWVDLQYKEFEGAVHNEAAWSRRFPDFLRWLT
jgi:predicted alpha/beta superfamily hydrolase